MQEVSEYLQGDFSRYCLENTYFYNLRHLKDRGLDSVTDVPLALANMGLEIVRPLQFQEANTTGFSRPRIFLCDAGDHTLVKARVCTSKQEAERIFSNVQIASSLGVRTPQVIITNESILISEFANGEHCTNPTDEQIVLVAQAHHKLNYQLPILENQLRQQLGTLFNASYNVIGEQLGQQEAETVKAVVEYNQPQKFIPVFDHQDLGVHNIIWSDDGQPVIIDEEAFGIIPFGYSLYRATEGRSGYKVCHTDQQALGYKKQFSDQQNQYFVETHDYWKNLLKVRSTARALIVGNVDLARKLITEMQS